MADNDLYLRSNSDKGESDPDNDLRLRSDIDKIPAAGAVPQIVVIYRMRRINN